MRRLPARWRMAIRGIGRERRRSVATATVVVLALTLILASWGMIDTVEILVHRQFDEVQRQDAQLYVDPDADVAAVVDRVQRVDGVDRAEAVATAPVVVVADDGRRYATDLVEFEPDTMMHGFDGAGPPVDGLVAGAALADLLGVSAGDPVRVIAPTDGTPSDGAGGTAGAASTTMPIAAFVDEPLGTFLYAPAGTLDDAGAGATHSAMVRFDDDADRAAMRASLGTLDGVSAYVDSQALYDTAQGMFSLFYAFVGVMVAFGALMAFALVLNTTTVTTAERAPELAAMTVNGASPRQLARVMAAENLAVAALALVPGLLIGIWVSSVFMAGFSSDLFSFDLQLRARTPVLSSIAILAVAAIAQWPASRTIASIDVARLARERSQ